MFLAIFAYLSNFYQKKLKIDFVVLPTNDTWFEVKTIVLWVFKGSRQILRLWIPLGIESNLEDTIIIIVLSLLLWIW